jgi:hypothetical protein
VLREYCKSVASCGISECKERLPPLVLVRDEAETPGLARGVVTKAE